MESSFERFWEMTMTHALGMEPPYLLFLGAAPDIGWAKTAAGICEWRRELCAGQYRQPGCDVDLGLPTLDIAGARAAGVRTMVLGIANDGGFIEPSWVPVMVEAMEAGLIIASGLHERLEDNAVLAAAAKATGARLINARHPDREFMPGIGKKRSGKRLLTVGTDCAVGKKYSALAIEKAMRARGMDADFRATGQTGIFISGRGVAVDSVVADFISGAAEWLSPDAAPDHWDIVEGQGALLHPAYAGVTMGLVHGTQPDAIVICHDPDRDGLLGFEDFPVARIEDARDVHLAAARLTNRDARAVGICLNTSRRDEASARALIAETGARYGLPCSDPIRFGVETIVDALEELSA